MKRKRYSEEQIIAILKEYEAGASMPDLARGRLLRQYAAHATIECRIPNC